MGFVPAIAKPMHNGNPLPMAFLSALAAKAKGKRRARAIGVFL
jgi:hypothetical protein